MHRAASLTVNPLFKLRDWLPQAPKSLTPFASLEVRCLQGGARVINERTNARQNACSLSLSLSNASSLSLSSVSLPLCLLSRGARAAALRS